MHARRPIRSFVLRAGRVTVAQERALAELWPSFGVDFDGRPLDLDALFGRRAPRCLEIGFGAGEVIGALAKARPETDHVGIEVHRAGVGRLLLHAQEQALANLRIICHDAVDVLASSIADDSFDSILTLVIANLGCTVLPAAAIQDELSRKQLQASLLVEPEVTRTLILATPNHRPTVRGFAQIANAIKTELRRFGSS